MADQNLSLIYVLKVGQNARRSNVYEFIFSSDPEDVDTDAWGWEADQARDNAECPPPETIDLTLRVETGGMVLEVLHDSYHFSYMDGYYSVIALAWEDSEEYASRTDDSPRLVFHYGESEQSVRKKIYARDIVPVVVE